MPETSRTVRTFLMAALSLVFAGLAFAQSGLHITVISGDGAVYTAGSRAAKPITVEVTDETGKPVEGARVSFQAPAEGPGGLFTNGLRTDLAVTDSSGRAVLRAIQLNRMPGPFSIRITAAKDQARAGIVARQLIGNAEPARALAAAAPKQPAVDSGETAASPSKPAVTTTSAPAQAQARSRTAPLEVSPGKRRPQPVILKDAAPAVPGSSKPANEPATSEAPARSRTAAVPTIVFTEKTPRSGSPAGLTSGSGSHKKWIWIGLLAAGGAAGGLFGSGMLATGAHGVAAASTANAAAVTIGAPTISIGKP
ncbi:MAG TPA: hypothetical protein VJN43_13385 [Bryobacteraceae bacterium]|nr:hypothetical protein [Bryobacteraceae bacterium]